MEFERTYPDWLLSAVITGLLVGPIALGTISYLTSEDSLFFSRGDAAMLGVFLGAIGGPLAGLLIWAIAALFVLIRRAVNRVKTGHPEGA